jgi:hypothetical protein
MHKPVREVEVNSTSFEGVVSDDISEWSEVLIRNIKSITSTYSNLS